MQVSETNLFVILCILLAAVVRQPGEPLVIEEIMVAPPMDREVRVRIICTSPSRTDISFWEMKVGIPKHAISEKLKLSI